MQIIYKFSPINFLSQQLSLRETLLETKLHLFSPFKPSYSNQTIRCTQLSPKNTQFSIDARALSLAIRHPLPNRRRPLECYVIMYTNTNARITEAFHQKPSLRFHQITSRFYPFFFSPSISPSPPRKKKGEDTINKIHDNLIREKITYGISVNFHAFTHETDKNKDVCSPLLIKISFIRYFFIDQ